MLEPLHYMMLGDGVDWQHLSKNIDACEEKQKPVAILILEPGWGSPNAGKLNEVAS